METGGEKAAPLISKNRLSCRKILATVFFDCRDSLPMIFCMSDAKSISSIPLTNASFWIKQRLNEGTREEVIPYFSIKQLEQSQNKMHRSALYSSLYGPDLSHCDFHLFGPP